MININTDKLVLEGEKDVLEILDIESTSKVLKVLWHKKALSLKNFQKIEDIALSKNIEFVELTHSEFKEIRKTVHSTGIFIVITRQQYDFENVCIGLKSCIIYLINFTWNLNMFLRGGICVRYYVTILILISESIYQPEHLSGVPTRTKYYRYLWFHCMLWLQKS